MALTNEDLQQIRVVVRNEIASSRSGRWWLWLLLPGILFLIFFAVLALHVLVIGGFTVYHLMTSSGSG